MLTINAKEEHKLEGNYFELGIIVFQCMLRNCIPVYRTFSLGELTSYYVFFCKNI